MEDSVTHDLRDYKFFTFDGVAKAMFIATDRQNPNEETKFDFYDMDFKHLDFRHGHPNANIKIARPEKFDEMRELAEKLSAKLPQLRVDFYEVNGKIYFGELTFSHNMGMVAFEPFEWDKKFGEWIKLPECNGGGGGYALIADGYILYLHQRGVNSLTDYKFYCFNGEVKYLYVSKGLEDHETARISFLNPDWTFAPFNRNDYKPFDKLPPKPESFELMKNFAAKLAAGTKFMRVDLYEINHKIYFSEYTFAPCCGMMPFDKPEYDKELGDLLKIN